MQSLREQCIQSRRELQRSLELMETGVLSRIRDAQGDAVDVTSEAIREAQRAIAVLDRILEEYEARDSLL